MKTALPAPEPLMNVLLPKELRKVGAFDELLAMPLPLKITDDTGSKRPPAPGLKV
jgi:hypothetical protein